MPATFESQSSRRSTAESDLDLTRRARGGDAAAFELIMRRPTG